MIGGLVSVIIPAYNSRLWIGRAIESVQAQTYRALEIIVIDDGSADGTGEFIKARFPQVKVYRQPNLGQSAARNAGVSRAEGEYLAFLDADDLWLPLKLELQLEAIKDLGKWGICATRRFKFRPGHEIVHPLIDESAIRAMLVDHLKLFEHNEIVMSSALVRREAFADVGGFDEGLRRVSDWDLWLRISKNWQTAVVDAPLTGYQRTPGALSSDWIGGQYAILRILQKWSGEYPQYIARLTRRAQASLVRKLLRAGRRDEAKELFHASGLAPANRGRQIRFLTLVAVWGLDGLLRRGLSACGCDVHSFRSSRLHG